MRLADLDTPSGFSSALEPSQISGADEAASALSYSVPSYPLLLFSIDPVLHYSKEFGFINTFEA